MNSTAGRRRKRPLPPPATVAFDAGDGWFSLTLPIKTVSEANARGKWQQIRRKADQPLKVKVWMDLYRNRRPSLPVTVRLTRIGPKALDRGDNLPASLKAVRDEVAAAYGQGDGEGSPLEFDYWQEPGSEQHAVRIEIRHVQGARPSLTQAVGAAREVYTRKTRMASKRRQRRQQCQGKARHETIEFAQVAADAIHRSRGVSVFPYRCGFCSYFHIGHDPERARGREHVWLHARRK